MSRRVELDLTLTTYPWRDVPMPGAKLPLSLTRLDSAGETFVVHGHFPAGFERSEAGGYVVTEEFLVLNGELQIGSSTYRPGHLTYIPAKYVRRNMRTTEGCVVLAWFGGPAIFHPEADLIDGTSERLQSVRVGPDTPADLLDLPTARWRRVAAGDDLAGIRGDVIDADLTRWRRLPAGETSCVAPCDAFVRVEL